MSETIYKLLKADLTSYGGYQWVVGEWRTVSGKGTLCGPGWLHAYPHPLLAVLLNPIHANIADPVLYRGEGRGTRRDDHGLKCGYTEMRIMETMPLPVLTTEQRVRFGLACACTVYRDARYRVWAEAWVAGTDRTAQAQAEAARAAAWAAEAAEAARAAAEAARAAAWAAAEPLDLIACAEWAVSESTDLTTIIGRQA